MIIVSIYVSFIFMCAMPWVFGWAMRGRMPVTVRLLALFVFSMFIVESGWVLWKVYAEAPDHVRDAVRLLAPIIFVSFIGVNLVVKSLVKLVAASHENNNDTDEGN